MITELTICCCANKPFEHAHRHAPQWVCYHTALVACRVSIMNPMPLSFDLYCLTDAKPGHRNQLRGLAERMAAHADCRIHWLDASQHPTPLWSILSAKPCPLIQPQGRGVLLGAGHRTHALLLRLGRAHALPTVVLMQPSWPLRWFDYAIVPAHDAVSAAPRVLCTEGAINTITPTPISQAEPGRGLLLVGGESAHFVWHDADILRQIEQLCTSFPTVHWVLSDSRRTPRRTQALLASALPAQVQYVPHTQTDAGWVPTELQRCEQVWVTPDSVSMVYEALTANRRAGILHLQARKPSRLQRGLAQLVAQQRLNTLDHPTASLAQPKPLWEADRAAQWLLDQLNRSG